MAKLDDAKKILTAIKMPVRQQSDMCCYVLLAMCNMTEKKSWSEAYSSWIRIHDIMQYISNNYGITYAENSRETIRKQALHNFRNAAIVEDNNVETNSPNYRYRITNEMLKLIHEFGSTAWHNSLSYFLQNHESLTELYSSKKEVTKMPVHINRNEYTFSSGKHNQLQKMILEEFAPRFAPNSICLYVGDTIEKDLHKDISKLQQLGFTITLHDKMPDVVLYRQDKDWIYFIEAVTSVGEMSAKRVIEINQMTSKVKSGKIYVTAFLDMATYRKFATSIAWETEVWLAEAPDHMIHLNGDKFSGPHTKR